jgi:hypothetical protein
MFACIETRCTVTDDLQVRMEWNGDLDALLGTGTGNEYGNGGN